MKVLVYGGTGYVGSKFLQYLVDKEVNVANVSRKKSNICNVVNFDFKQSDQQIIEDYKPHVVVYLSACFNDNVNELIDINVKRPLEILSVLTERIGIQFICIGSYWQFGDSNYPLIPIDLYSASKKSMKPFLDYYNQYTEVKCKEIVLYGTYGESDSRGKLLDFLLQSAMGSTVVKLTDGFQKLNLVHIDDVCKSIYELISDESGNYFQVYSENDYSPRDLVELINSYVKLDVEFGKVEYRKVELMKPYKTTEYIPIVVPDRIENFIINQLNKK